jgi:predicted phage tail protein
VWDTVPDATSYNVYWSDSPGVNRHNGRKISDIKKPTATIKGLRRGTTYYFVVTTVKGTTESRESKELSFTVHD